MKTCGVPSTIVTPLSATPVTTAEGQGMPNPLFKKARCARYRQRKSILQRELDTAARLFRRQVIRGQGGSAPTLQAKGQRKTEPPRRFCLVAGLFGGADCHPMYVLGALKLASALPAPWALWLAVDESTMQAWQEQLLSAYNIHCVIVRRPEQESGSARLRRPTKWAVNTFMRYLLLDDAMLASAIVVDLDVQAKAAESALKLWRSADAAADDEHDIAYGVVKYPVGSRGMEGALALALTPSLLKPHARTRARAKARTRELEFEAHARISACPCTYSCPCPCPCTCPCMCRCTRRSPHHLERGRGSGCLASWPTVLIRR